MNKWMLNILKLTCILQISTTIASPPKVETQSQFIQKLSNSTNLQADKIQAILKKAHVLNDVIQKMNTPYESKPLDIYQKHFLSKNRINNGVEFWRAHEQTFKKEQTTYGVDPSVIIAILGVETLYGANEGHYTVLDSLYTLGFHYPKRAHFFQKELGQFLLLTHNQHLSPLVVKGSYAGAFGMPQFMPSSYRAYGIDAHHNHHIDLMHDADDVIMSVGNYLAKAGWQKNMPITDHVSSYKKINKLLINNHAKPTTTVASLKDSNLLAKNKNYPEKLAASVIDFKLSNSKHEYWITYNNFRSILRYNQSPNYAIVVTKLALAIRNKHDKQIHT